MTYRTEQDIIASILDIANKSGGCSKTDILYGARLTYFQLVKTYLPMVISKKLVSYNESKNVYKTTEKGLKVLSIQTEYAQLMKNGLIN